MCGIAGILSGAITAEDVDLLRTMTRTLAHRGPDGEGIWNDSRVALGHRRLSIIDLSRKASQPMHSADKSLHIVFNGEIYNYRELAEQLVAKGIRLRTHSDTEVILQLYQAHGTKAFEMLRGMFAFALWDSGHGELLLVRDRIGIKPLYYLHDGITTLWASEIKAIAVARPHLTLNRDALWSYFRTATVQGSLTIFGEVRRVEPGSFLSISSKGLKQHRFWDMRSVYAIPPKEYQSVDEAVEQFEGVFSDSVRYHLVSDVPVGGFLSGGLDSSMVIAHMRRLQQSADISTFSITFPTENGGFDESPYSAAVARQFRTIHKAFPFESDFVQELDGLAWHGDEPFAIFSSYALYFLAREAAKQVKVVLSGDGGDELLAGYQGYAAFPNGYAGALRAAMQAAGTIGRVATTFFPVGREYLDTAWIKLLRKGGSRGLRYSEHSAYTEALYFTVLNREFISEAWKGWEKNNGAVSFDALSGASDLRRMLYSSMKSRLVDEMLTKVDRMTMAHSLEARVPLLDHVFAEFCIQLGDSLKLSRRNGGSPVGKYILKKAAERHLSHELVYREKHGFDIPIGEWLAGGLLDRFREEMLEGWLVRAGIVNPERLKKIMAEHLARERDHGQFLGSILMFGRWMEAYRSRIPGFSLSA